MRLKDHFLRRMAMVRELDRSLDQIRPIDERYRDKTIVIASVRPSKFFQIYELVLGFMFSLFGARTIVLLADSSLAHRDVIKWEQNPPGPIRRLILRPTKRLLVSLWQKLLLTLPGKFWELYGLKRRSRVERYSYRQFIRRDLEPEIQKRFETLRGGDLSNGTDSSHKRYFGGREYDPKNPLHVEYLKLSIRNEVVSEEVAEKACLEFKPAVFIVLDGIYSSAGTIKEEFQKRGVASWVYQPCQLPGRKLLLSSSHCSVPVSAPMWKEFLENFYDTDCARRTRRILNERLRSNSSFSPIPGLKGKRVIGLFPNMTWDGAIQERDTIFKSMGDWLFQTIDWVAAQKDVALVIREHPQSKETFTEYDSALSLLQERYPHLTERSDIHLIGATDPTSSYELIGDQIDCAVVYNGTLGSEIPFLKKPLIFAGSSPYHYVNIAQIPKSQDQYFKLLKTLTTQSPEHIKLSKNIEERATMGYALRFEYLPRLSPLMPEMKRSDGPYDRYWHDWGLEHSSLDPRNNPDWMRTLERFLNPFKESSHSKRPRALQESLPPA